MAASYASIEKPPPPVKGEDLPVIDFHGASLWQSDIDTTKPGSWLNDNVMTFWAEFLTYEVFGKREDYCFMHPSACFMARFLPNDDVPEAFEALQLQEKGLVFIPVNDNTDVEATAAGSHWSMLVWMKRERRFRHYDSSHGHNKAVAQATAAALFNVLRPDDEKVLEAKSGKPTLAEVVHETTPQQTNGSDCGVYAMVIAHALAAADGHVEADELSKLVTPKQVADARKRMRSVLLDMSAMNRLELAVIKAASGGVRG